MERMESLLLKLLTSGSSYHTSPDHMSEISMIAEISTMTMPLELLSSSSLTSPDLGAETSTIAEDETQSPGTADLKLFSYLIIFSLFNFKY